MSPSSFPRFEMRTTPQAEILSGRAPGTGTLQIPAGPSGQYRLAQLDDGSTLTRDTLPWQAPVRLQLRARASAPNLPGTWGFGFWNDPFSLSLGFGGGLRRFPALPNAAWFFFASPQNYLSLRDDLPANGFIAQVFRAPRFPAVFLALGALGFPLLLWPWLARKLRAGGRPLVLEAGFPVKMDVTQWHSYTLAWQMDHVIFTVDRHTFKTHITPNGPLGFILWIDNQYAAFSPDGRLAYGTLASAQSARLEIEELTLTKEK